MCIRDRLDEAKAIVVVPDTIKAGVVLGGRRGLGLMSVKSLDGTWSNPVFVKLAGASFGLQAGVQSADVILVFRSDRGAVSYTHLDVYKRQVLHGDLFQRLQAIHRETWTGHVDTAHAIARQLLQGCHHIRLQPFAFAEARLIGQQDFIAGDAQRLGDRLGAGLALHRIRTVSYTHLDVYKRQEKAMQARGWKREMSMQSSANSATLIYTKDKRQTVYQMMKADNGGTQLAVRTGSEN